LSLQLPAAFPVGADDQRSFAGFLAVHACVHKFLGHHPPPLSDAALQCPKLSFRELTRTLAMQPVQQ
jgi:hypothetical protein